MEFCGLQSDKWILLYKKYCPILYRTAFMIFLPVLQADIYTKMWCFHWISFLCNAIRNAQCRDCTLQHGEQTANRDLLLNQTAHTKHWIIADYKTIPNAYIPLQHWQHPCWRLLQCSVSAQSSNVSNDWSNVMNFTCPAATESQKLLNQLKLTACVLALWRQSLVTLIGHSIHLMNLLNH